MSDTDYTVVVRTFNSAETLPALFASLHAQTVPPARVIVVDSGSTDDTVEIAKAANAFVIRYLEKPFNYSTSINLGVYAVRTRFTLVASSHVRMTSSLAMEGMLTVLEGFPEFGAGYFHPHPVRGDILKRITRENFSGTNGLFNLAACYRSRMLHERPFRPEVWAAEDMEWSRWLLNQGKEIACIRGCISYENPRGYPWRKRLNEELAIATFVKPEQRKGKYLLRVAYRVIRPVSTWAERIHNARLLWALFTLRDGYTPPHYF
jgi:glycosyltransferase involved in cell wall biosynthesis